MFITLIVVLLLVAAFYRFPLYLSSSLILIFTLLSEFSLTVRLIIYVVIILLNLKFIRRFLISLPIMKLIKKLKLLPTISETEKIALESGTVWMDGELFSGKPNLKKLFSQPINKLSDEEKQFLDGPVEKLCSMVNDWDVYRKRDFSSDAWNFMKENKFFGMIIPKKYGGLEFSANAHSEVIQKLSSRTPSLGITVMVPNSLGPAELIIHYGTDEQKNYYLPRLAIGKEIPCFALTEPFAGSDAGSMTSSGIIFSGSDGTPWMRLSWNKRYITLASISTILGIAFKLRDPENILGKGTELGITCALVPSSTKGVVIGRRHDPLSIPFINCPTQGNNVELPISSVIGGIDGVGKGWKMLMECLAAGRGISLPASSTAGVKFVARVVSAYASIRKQFGLSIGKFEGIEEPISRIAGNAYLSESLRSYTCAGIDAGAKPAVVTAISKYHSTELNRKSINDGMDILGGAGISLGPKNLLASPYFIAPVAITVEGANILTRTLIIFGQGVIRCHPFVLKEMNALEKNDLVKFDDALFSHIGFILSNLIRCTVLFLTCGLIILQTHTKFSRYAQKLSWASAEFALLADLTLLSLGGNLKRKENISARFGDVLSWMYIASAVINKFENEGSKREDFPFAKWSLEFCFAKIQEAFEGIYLNMGFISKIYYCFTKINPIGKYPSDKLSGKIARQIQSNEIVRNSITKGIYISKDENDSLAKLELAFSSMLKTEGTSKKLQDAMKKKIIPRTSIEIGIQNGIITGVISEIEGKELIESEKMCKDAIQVDDFSESEYLNRN